LRILRLLLVRSFEWVLYEAESLEPADLSGLTLEKVGPQDAFTLEQREFLGRHIRRLSLWHLLKWKRRGRGWVFFAGCDDTYAHYTFVTPASRYRKIFPMLRGPKALLIGPCLTEENFRGRSIYPRVLQYVVSNLADDGYGPFYIDSSPDNTPSIRGVEKAGFQRRGVWAGKRFFLDAFVATRRVGD
jgi:hypothetical protein